MISLEPSNPEVEGGLSTSKSVSLSGVLGNFVNTGKQTYPHSLGAIKQQKGGHGLGMSSPIPPPHFGGSSRSYGSWGVMDTNNHDVKTVLDEESKSFLQASISVVTDGASKVFSTASSAVSAASGGGNPLGESVGTMNSQTLLISGVLAGVGVLFMFLAFLTLPLIVFAPSKFAFFFTSGSGCCFAALANLKGVIAFFRHLIEPSRLPFSVAYVGSLVVTLYSTLVVKSYLLTLIFSMVQLVALGSFLVSYIPGGTGMLKFLGGTVWQMLKRFCNCQDPRNTTLPL